VNPARLAWGLKRVCAAKGVRFHERTPIDEIRRSGDGVRLAAPGAVVHAKQVVLATNAYSIRIPELRRKQAPVFTHVVLSEPLSPERLEPIGWRGREGIEDARNLVHYYRLTRENRLLMGGGDATLGYGERLDYDLSERVFGELERHAQAVFPSLRGVGFTHRWGGPVSVPVDLAPVMGFLGDERIVYSVGCMGHGVSLAHLNGRALADLTLGNRSDLASVFFVDRRTLPWPPEPLRWIASRAILGWFHAEDRRTDRDPGGRSARETAT
jgi:glycine/D-amino acid oxidase-like deaminating enzyme